MACWFCLYLPPAVSVAEKWHNVVPIDAAIARTIATFSGNAKNTVSPSTQKKNRNCWLFGAQWNNEMKCIAYKFRQFIKQTI